jgi:hypothetical protein
VFVAGQLIGFVYGSNVKYWDPYEQTITAQFSTIPTWSGPTTRDAFQSTEAFPVVQNSWTGHVTITRNTAPFTLINFIPSVMEDKDDYSALGSPKPADPKDVQGDNWKEFTPTPLSAQYISRDWSWRQWGSYSLTALEGTSSVAGALWAVMVNEPNLDSARWGGGLDPSYFSLASFESLHSYCVGPILRRDPSRVAPDPKKWYAERFKFDYLLDGETNLSSFVAGEILTSVNGFRAVVGGKMYVGINRKGVFPTWHFTEESFADASPKLAFAGRGGNPNRVRVMFTNVKDEYRKDFAEANNEFDQNALGRVQAATLSVNGIARFSHADLLAKTVLDGSQSARRQFEFKTHYLGLVITAGDAIEVSHQATGLKNATFRVGMLEEGDDGSITVTAQELVRARDTIRSDPPKKIQVVGPGDVSNPCPCFRVTPVMQDTGGTWFNGGATFPAGTYRLRYIGGAYKDSRTNAYGMDYYGVFTMVDGIVLKLKDGPKSGVENTDVGVLIAYALSTVPTMTITLNEPGPIGMIAPTFARNNDGGQGGNATFELCPPSNCDGNNPVPDPIIESDNGGAYYTGPYTGDVSLTGTLIFDWGSETIPTPLVYYSPGMWASEYEPGKNLVASIIDGVLKVMSPVAGPYYALYANATGGPEGLWTFAGYYYDGPEPGPPYPNGTDGKTWPATIMATITEGGSVGGVLL